jgi:hypothetical protein
MRTRVPHPPVPQGLLASPVSSCPAATAATVTGAGEAAVSSGRAHRVGDIYDHADLLEEIRQQRRGTPVMLAPRPAAERSTIASLQARLRGAH